jgi:CheY-like chemotaxis protein
MLLTELGYEVLETADGQGALSQLERNQGIDLLFVDLVLPDGLSGTELAAEAQRRCPNLKVLYTSGYTKNAVIHQGKLDKGVHLLSKPYRKGRNQNSA